jgi:hypothetical protein
MSLKRGNGHGWIGVYHAGYCFGAFHCAYLKKVQALPGVSDRPPGERAVDVATISALVDVVDAMVRSAREFGEPVGAYAPPPAQYPMPIERRNLRR